MSKPKEVIFHLHFYQPPCVVSHKEFQNINADPHGVDWTTRITNECYSPLVKLGVIPQVTFDYFGVLGYRLGQIDPQTDKVMRENLCQNGVADSFIHPLLPDLSDNDKRISIGVGISRYFAITGQKPRFFWPPETAIDTPTLEIMADYKIEGFFCSPDQIQLENGGNSGNQPARIKLPSGRKILALPFNRFLSRNLAFDDEYRYRSDAHRFADEVILPELYKLKNGFPLLGCTDGETFGHHMRWGANFIDALVNHALSARDVRVVSINDVDWEKVTVVDGRIKEKSAWSCIHGDLARWHGRCSCGGGDVGWKKVFSCAIRHLNRDISKVVKPLFGKDYLWRMVGNFEAGFENPGGYLSRPDLSLISAKVSALTAQTSCGTFHDNPGIAGGVNILFARQAVEHLKDTGLVKEAGIIWSQFLNTMQYMRNSAWENRTGVEMAKAMLGDRFAV